MPTPGRVHLHAALLTLAAAVTLAACSRAGDALAEAAIGRAAGAPAPAAGEAGVPGDTGPLPLPAGFPGDVYLPPRYEIDSALDMDGTTMVNLRVAGQVDALFADAAGAMTQLGWQRTLSRRDAGHSAVLAFEKGPRIAVLSFARGHGDGDATLGLQLHERQQ